MPGAGRTAKHREIKSKVKEYFKRPRTVTADYYISESGKVYNQDICEIEGVAYDRNGKKVQAMGGTGRNDLRKRAVRTVRS